MAHNEKLLTDSKEGVIDAYIECVPSNENIQRLFDDFRTLFRYAPGSRGAHHYWYGGWMDHNQQMLDKYTCDYEWFMEHGWLDELPTNEQFIYHEGIVVILMHDMEKPFKYAELVEGITEIEIPSEFTSELEDKANRKTFRETLMEKYGITLNSIQQNALRYVEGVRDYDYIPGERTDKPLAALCHSADLTSSRIGYDIRGPYYVGEITAYDGQQ